MGFIGIRLLNLDKFISMKMFCSTIIPTIGRQTLEKAIESVLDQAFTKDEFEVIVVNDSGYPLPAAIWKNSKQVRIITTQKRERSVARNVGAALARGQYLHFLDDDDWLLPGAFESFWHLVAENPAAWLYGGYELVDREGELLQVCRPDEQGNCAIRFAAGEWLPLQVSLIRSEAFFKVGGFASLNALGGGDEDVDLSRKISLAYDVAGIDQIVAKIRFGEMGSTTNYTTLHQQSLISRELMLNTPKAANRLLDSARSRPVESNYWHGRIIWIYLASIIFNIQQGQPFTAISRLFSLFSSFFRSGKHLFSARYWKGATRPHVTKGWLSTKI